MNRIRSRAAHCMALCLSVWLAPGLAGCSAGGSGVLPVAGVVKVDGKPADGVQVSFWPADGSDARDRYGAGQTDAAGRFEIRSVAAVGLPAGEYKVTFSRPLSSAGKAAADPNRKPVQARESLPAKYQDRDATDQTARVAAGSHEFTFDLVTGSK